MKLGMKKESAIGQVILNIVFIIMSLAVVLL